LRHDRISRLHFRRELAVDDSLNALGFRRQESQLGGNADPPASIRSPFCVVTLVDGDEG
jgi:hypothetical protein